MAGRPARGWPSGGLEAAGTGFRAEKTVLVKFRGGGGVDGLSEAAGVVDIGNWGFWSATST